MDEQFINSINQQFENFVNENNITNSQEISILKRKLFDTLSTNDEIPVLQILAPNIVVEVVDASTGYLYRRYLEIRYEETDRGLRLKGEDLSGTESEIVFLSNSAIEKIAELKGKGPDNPRCEH